MGTKLLVDLEKYAALQQEIFELRKTSPQLDSVLSAVGIPNAREWREPIAHIRLAINQLQPQDQT